LRARRLNAAAFGGALPETLAAVTWNAKLKTTAGLTYSSRVTGRSGPAYVARIELSRHVVDDAAKLRHTLAHELCHAAAWIVRAPLRMPGCALLRRLRAALTCCTHAPLQIDKDNKPPHGPTFRKWAARVMAACPGLDVAVCHSYDIAFAFRYACQNAECGVVYGRHSASIDTARKACGECGGPLALQPRLNADGTPAAKRAPTAFAAFVKEHFKKVKKAMPAAAHADVMRELSVRWKAQQRKATAGSPAKGDGPLQEALRALQLSD